MFENYDSSDKLKRTAFIFVLMLGTFLNAAAQELTFEDNDLYALKDKARQMLEGKTLRITSTEEWFENGSKAPVRLEKSINEVIPPDRSHFVSERQTPQGFERTEYIDIGRQRYIKENKGEWKEFKGSGGGIGSGEGNGSGEDVKIETTVARKLKKGEIVNRQKVDLYETVVTQKYIYPTRIYTTVRTEAFWFDNKGRYVKTLEEYREGDMKVFSRTTQEYEYDLKNIKIEAPIIKADSKQKPE